MKEESNEMKFDEIIELKNSKAYLEKRINQLKQRIKSEKQFNRKVELNKELNILMKELED